MYMTFSWRLSCGLMVALSGVGGELPLLEGGIFESLWGDLGFSHRSNFLDFSWLGARQKILYFFGIGLF